MKYYGLIIASGTPCRLDVEQNNYNFVKAINLKKEWNPQYSLQRVSLKFKNRSKLYIIHVVSRAFLFPTVNVRRKNK